MNTPSELKLGDDTLDRDHAELQSLAVRLLSAAPENRLAALDALREHAQRHFGEEDADLRLMNDGNVTCHLDEHANVLKSFDEVHAALLADVYDAAFKDDMARRLALQLMQWLPEHVQQMDAAVASHRAKRRFGGAPVVISRRSST